MKNIISETIRKELVNEVAGISFVVRRWAKILKKEVEEQLVNHKKDELAKIEAKKTKTPEKNSNKGSHREATPEELEQLEIDFPVEENPKNDPFYWEDETGSSNKGSSGTNWDEYDEWERRFRYDKKSDWRDRDNNQGKYYKKKKEYLGNPESYNSGSSGSQYGYPYNTGSYGGYNYTPQPYIPPLDEVVVYGDSFPEEFKEFGVDMWVMKNSGRIEYDHYKSGYAESGEYIVYLNIPLTTMSETAFVHEIKHAYDDWNRMRHGGKPIRDSWEIKNIYTKDFEKLILGATTQFPQLGPIIRNLYLGSKLEMPAYLENEYDNSMLDYEDVGRKLMKFKATNYLDKRGNAAHGIEREFEAAKKYDIPLFKKFKTVVEFLYWVEKYFNKRGKDIFQRVGKMRHVHGKEKPKYTYTPTTYSSYKKPEPVDDDKIGDWKYSKDKGWHIPEEKEKEQGHDFKEGDTMGGWKYSAQRGWHFAPDEDEDDYDPKLDTGEPWY